MCKIQNGNTNIVVASALVTQKSMTERLQKFNEVNKNYYSTYSVAKSQKIVSGKLFKPTERLGRKVSADILLNHSADEKYVSFASKYKKRYKFFNANQIVSLFLYSLNKMKLGNIEIASKLKKINVLTTDSSSKLIDKISLDNKIKVKKIFEITENVISHYSRKKKTVLVFDNERIFFIIDGETESFIPFAIQMFDFFKKNDTNPYEVLNSIYKKYGIHRIYSYSKKMSDKQFNLLIKTIKKSKAIGDHKVLSIDANSQGLDCSWMVTFKDSSTLNIKKTDGGDSALICIENIGKPGHVIGEIITFEKKVEAFINDNSESFEDKKFTWKTFLKYLAFVVILAGTIALIFNVIYSDVSGSGKTSIKSTISAASALWHSTNAWAWMIIWIWKCITLFISAWSKKRMFTMMGENVKTRHLVVSAIMGGIIAFITPFTIGGDAIGYWYLRRKGVKRAPLIAALSSSTLIGEAKFTLQTALLVAIGWPIYQQVFDGSIESKAALVWFFCGLAWSIFSTTMIFIVTLSRRFQNLIISKGIVFLEWFRYTHVFDPWKKTAELSYEFSMMRGGMKRIWTTWYFPFELLFYALLPLFFQPTTIIYACSGIIRPDLNVNPYFAIIVGNDIVNTANSMSFLPGGSGTGEWLSRSVFSEIFVNNTNQFPYSSTVIANGSDFFWKAITAWPWLVFSSVMTLMTVFTESARRNRRKWKAATILSLMLVAITYLIIYFVIY